MKPPIAQLTSRDLAILRTLFECRIATYAHLATLHFEGRFEAAKKRCHKLIVAGFLATRRRSINEPIILSLTRKALTALQDRSELHAYPELARRDMHKRTYVAPATINHELAVMDVRCAFIATLATHQCQLNHFSTWPLLYSFHARPAMQSQRILVRPEDILQLATPRPTARSSFQLSFSKSIAGLKRWIRWSCALAAIAISISPAAWPLGDRWRRAHFAGIDSRSNQRDRYPTRRRFKRRGRIKFPPAQP